MIYILHGNNTEKAREKSHAIVDSLRTKRPDASFFSVNADTWNTIALDELIGGQGLFAQKYIIFFDNISENADAKELIGERTKEIAESDNIFIFLEKKLDKVFAALEKKAEKSQEFSRPEGKKEFGGGMFALADALGMRDKKHLWILFDDARRKDTEWEEMHGIFWWQVKSMILASKTASAEEAGLKPFVYKKSLGFAKNFKPAELEKMSHNLVTMYHQAHRGVVDFGSELERWVLVV
ncbi:MAG: hypothetical protein WC757_04370 [Candidatus Paceibacterota bacterium]|jgi:DNA polymerase III delta subunit